MRFWAWTGSIQPMRLQIWFRQAHCNLYMYPFSSPQSLADRVQSVRKSGDVS